MSKRRTADEIARLLRDVDRDQAKGLATYRGRLHPQEQCPFGKRVKSVRLVPGWTRRPMGVRVANGSARGGYGWLAG